MLFSYVNNGKMMFLYDTAFILYIEEMNESLFILDFHFLIEWKSSIGLRTLKGLDPTCMGRQH